MLIQIIGYYWALQTTEIIIQDLFIQNVSDNNSGIDKMSFFCEQ